MAKMVADTPKNAGLLVFNHGESVDLIRAFKNTSETIVTEGALKAIAMQHSLSAE